MQADWDRLEPEIKAFRKEVIHRDFMPRIVSFNKARELLLRVKTDEQFEQYALTILRERYLNRIFSSVI
jgi:hypothetical protein